MEKLSKKLINKVRENTCLDVRIQKTIKNNGIETYELVFGRETETPVICEIDTILEKLLNKEISIEDASDEIIQKINQVDIINKQIKNVRLNKEYILKNVFFETLNFIKNIEKLDELPFIKILDLVNIFRVKIDVSEESLSFLINYKLMNKYNISLKELEESAKKNINNLHTPIFFPLYQMFELDDWDEYKHNYDEDVTNELYCLTYKEKEYGSAILNSSEKLEEIADKLKSDLIIIPSSTNELLIFRKYNNWKMLAMKLIEQKQDIPKDMFLSNNVYRYEREKKLLEIVSEEVFEK